MAWCITKLWIGAKGRGRRVRRHWDGVKGRWEALEGEGDALKGKEKAFKLDEILKVGRVGITIPYD